jgi:hypothetical protein
MVGVGSGGKFRLFSNLVPGKRNCLEEARQKPLDGRTDSQLGGRKGETQNRKKMHSDETIGIATPFVYIILIPLNSSIVIDSTDHSTLLPLSHTT